MHYLYRKTQGTPPGECSEFLSRCSVGQFAVSPFRLRAKGERIGVKAALGRLYFWLVSFGGCRIWYLRHGSQVVHTSCVVPRCCKFPFLKKDEYEIGPCVTQEAYRSRGIYQYMLRCITASQPDAVFYMIVRSTNEPSVRGIEKAGFQRCGTVVRSRFLKNYHKENG